MSFLNPVNEPVLRFSSTDVGAPQINYASRTSGDLKAVLKACLVTGYGAKASAGWSIVNEVNHVAEFVSPSAAMSDYRLGVNDTSASSTTWYYQHQNSRVNPSSNTVTKNPSDTNKTHPKNGWILLVSPRGFYLIESIYVSVYSDIVARLTCFGQLKSALETVNGKNMAFWAVGLGSASITAAHFFKPITGQFAVPPYHVVEGYSSSLIFAGANLNLLEKINGGKDSKAELINTLYIVDSESLIAEYPGILIKNTNNIEYNVYEATVGGRQVLYACLGVATSNTATPARFSVPVMIYLDYWEY